MRTAIRFIGIYIGLSVLLGLTWAILSYPDIPSTAGEWLWILVLALPVQLAFEFMAQLAWNNKATRFVERKTAAKPFSPIRILYGVFLLLISAGVLLGAGWVWRAFGP